METQDQLQQQGMEASVLLADALIDDPDVELLEEQRHMLALTEFRVGDLALFLDWKRPGMLAFHVSSLALVRPRPCLGREFHRPIRRSSAPLTHA